MIKEAAAWSPNCVPRRSCRPTGGRDVLSYTLRRRKSSNAFAGPSEMSPDGSRMRHRLFIAPAFTPFSLFWSCGETMTPLLGFQEVPVGAVRLWRFLRHCSVGWTQGTAAVVLLFLRANEPAFMASKEK